MRLPKEAVVDGTYPVSLVSLAPLLVSGDLPVQSPEANLVLKSFDKKTGVAVLRGPVQIEEKGERDGLDHG